MTNSDYKDMYDSAPIGLWRSGVQDGKLLSANQEMATILGYRDVDELSTYVERGHYNGFREALRQALNEGDIQNLEVPLERKDGSEVWVSLSAQLHADKGYIEGSIRDISEDRVFALTIMPYIDKIKVLKQHIKQRLDQHTHARRA